MAGTEKLVKQLSFPKKPDLAWSTGIRVTRLGEFFSFWAMVNFGQFIENF
jgi:hypothetical protein